MKLKDVIKGSNFTQGDKFLSTFQILIFASVFSNFGLIKFIFGFVLLVLILDIFFSQKKLVLSNLTVMFQENICRNFSYTNSYQTRELG